MLGIIVYVVILVLEYNANGESLFFWIWAGIGILAVLFCLIALCTPDKQKEKEDLAMENWVDYWAAGGPKDGKRSPDDRARLAPPPEGLQRNKDRQRDEMLAMMIGLSDD